MSDGREERLEREQRIEQKKKESREVPPERVRRQEWEPERDEWAPERVDS